MRRLVCLAVVAGVGCASAPRRSLEVFPLAGATCSRGFDPGERHFALDVAAAEGTPVVASGAGLVLRASVHPTYGLTVILEHPRLVYTLYAHLASASVVPGDRVDAGDRIGAVGSSGNARGAHLHFEVLAAGAPLPIRATGPIGLRGEEHRLDPAALLDAPPGCGPPIPRAAASLR